MNSPLLNTSIINNSLLDFSQQSNISTLDSNIMNTSQQLNPSLLDSNIMNTSQQSNISTLNQSIINTSLLDSNIMNTSKLNQSTLNSSQLLDSLNINNCIIKKQPKFNSRLKIEKSDFLRMKVVGQFNKGFILCTLTKSRNYERDVINNVNANNIFNGITNNSKVDKNVNDSNINNDITDSKNMNKIMNDNSTHISSINTKLSSNNNNINNDTHISSNNINPSSISNSKNTLTTHLIIIDQHASDEIYNYESLLSKLTLKKQKLVVPLNLNLSKIDLVFVNDYKHIFNKYGFVIEDGMLMTVPVYKDKGFGVDEFWILLENIKNDFYCDESGIDNINGNDLINGNDRIDIINGKDNKDNLYCDVDTVLEGKYC